FEVETTKFFPCPPVPQNPRNHCTPILEVLQDPDDDGKKIVVMPRLMNYEPIFDTVGEVGVQFMHENFVAHRDYGVLNIAVEPSQPHPHGFHPVNVWRNPANDGFASYITRTKCRPRYYIIDFGLSCCYGPEKSPLEHRRPSRCNPFHTDIYYLGNLLK
ncbi:hypothetical protein B0H17DRAFT_847449, partial [Mycena rosella]